MDVIAGTVVSSAESVVITVYHSLMEFFHMGPYYQHEGFHPRVTQDGYPVDPGLSKRGEGADDAFRTYKPYLRKTEFSSRAQHDNHRWPSSREMLGPFEQTLRKDIVLPCNYPVPGVSSSKTGKLYASFM